MSNLIRQVAITTDGKLVLAGLFRVYETEGLALDIILSACQQNNAVPSWIDLYIEMISAGMKHTRILSKLEEAICDSYGKEWSDLVISRLDQMFKKEKK